MLFSIPIALMFIMLLAISSQWFSWKLKLPAILFLLASGIIFGPISELVFHTALINPIYIFGDRLFYPMVSLSVSIILFEGCMSLKFSEIKGSGKVVRNFVSIGLLFTAVCTAVLSHYLLNFPWQVAAMLGAIASVSGPTVVIPILRSVRPTKNIANIIRWEGMLVDPLGALSAVVVFIAISNASRFDAVWHVIAIILTGIIVGLISGYLLGLVLRRHWVPDYLSNLFVLSVIIITFVLVEAVFNGSGLLTVSIMGIIVGNMRNTNIDEIVDFKENLTILLISILFVILGANITFTGFESVIFPAILMILILQCLVRPIVSFFCTLGSTLNWRERVLLGWIAPRGIIAASVAAAFSIEIMALPSSNIDYQLYGRLLGTVTFLIIIGTVFIESLTAPLLARILKVSEPDPRGFLIVGANKFAREIAKSLAAQDLSVQMSDVNWKDVQAAKLDGLNCYYGSPSSDHAAWHLDLVGIGRMIGLSSDGQMNSISAVKYRREFGSNTIFVLPTSGKNDGPQEINKKYSKRLFTKDVTYEDLEKMLGFDVNIKTTSLTFAFGWDEYMALNGNNIMPLFAVDSKQQIRIFSPDTVISPSAGWKIIALVINDDGVLDPKW
ncbi:MAG: NhaP-type Na+/H+ or K+/H+ antiporter [Francisellaceae bacterium]|jgi:NhaP-type Na+/H+ or K+/H+ antiporter